MRAILTPILPKALKREGTIGLVAPAGPIPPSKFFAGVKKLERDGFRVFYRKDILSKRGHLAGTDERRADELHEMALNAKVDAILCVRGGFGSSRLIPHLKPRILKAHPKIFLGFSDITTLHVFFQKLGIATFHGPSLSMLSVPSIQNHFFKDVQDIFVKGRPVRILGRSFTKVIRPGSASGRVIGGNLQVISHTIGTDYEIDTDGAILLIEEVNEAPYRLDRLITHLKLAQKLKHLKGLIIGEITYDPPQPIRPKEILNVFQDHFSNAPYPVLFHFPFGHGRYNPIIPLGVEGKINTKDSSLTTDPAVLIDRRSVGQYHR